MKMLSIQDAINEAIHEEMARDSTVFVMGEDVGLYGGHQEVTKGVYDRFGESRCIDTPCSEGVIAGAAVGAAIDGMRPIAEIQHIDFIPLALDAIVNHATALPYAYGGQITVPMVIRTQGGSYTLGAQHAKSLESWLVHIPGLIVIQPSNPADAKGLLKSAIRNQNPVVFIEHKLTYRQQGLLPEGEFLIEIGKAAVRREGRDITVVATSRMVEESMAAAEILSSEGIEIEVIDPRTLMPFDDETVLRSLEKTGRLLVVYEGWTTGGIGSEVVSRICERGFQWFKAPPLRLGAADVPLPFSPPLEAAARPDAKRIVDAVHRQMNSTIRALSTT